MLSNGIIFSRSNTRTSRCQATHYNVNTIFRRPRSRVIAAIARSSITFKPRGLTVRRSRVNLHVSNSLSTISVDSCHTSSPAHVDNNRRRHVTVTNVLTVSSSILILSRPATVLSPRKHTSVVQILSRLRSHNAAVVLIARRTSRLRRTSHIVRLRTNRVMNSNPTSRQLQVPIRSINLPGHVSSRPTRALVRTHSVSCHCISTRHSIFGRLSFDVNGNRAITLVKHGNTNGAALTHVLYTLRGPAANSVIVSNVTITATGTGNKAGPLGHGGHAELHHAINCIVRRPRQRLFTSAITRSITCKPSGLKLSTSRTVRHTVRTVQLLRVRRLQSHSPFSLSNNRRQLITVTNIVTYRPGTLVLSRPATNLSRRTTTHIRKLVRRLGSHNIAVLLVSRSRSRISRLTSHAVVLNGPTGHTSSGRSARSAIGTAYRRRPSTRPSISTTNSSATAIKRQQALLRHLSPHINVLSTLTLVFSTFTVNSF